MGWIYVSNHNFNGITVEVWEWISNFIPYFMMDVITYPCWDLSKTMSVKGAPEFHNVVWSKATYSKSLRGIETKKILSELHYSDVIMAALAPQITGVSIVHSTICAGTDQRKHQSSASLAFMRGIHRWPVNSPHKGPVTRKMFPFDDVITASCECMLMA